MGAAAGFGAAGFAAGAAGFSAGADASLPAGGGAPNPSGFCSSAMRFPKEDHYIYHLLLGSVKRGAEFSPQAASSPATLQVTRSAGAGLRTPAIYADT